MDSDMKVLSRFIFACLALMVTGIGSCTFNSYDRRHTMAAMVKDGADPVRVMCAFLSEKGTAETNMCLNLKEK